MGISDEDLRRRVHLVNLLSSWPGEATKGDAFPINEARDAAAALMPTLVDSAIILAGRRVERAFGVGKMPWFRWYAIDFAGIPGPQLFAVMPHPSGVSRAWNDRLLEDDASMFLKNALIIHGEE